MIKTINQAIAKRRAEGDNEKGFTLIELLVVVLIIGILAAIAIPAFLAQREGAWRSQIESDLNSARIAAETFASKKNGNYTGIEATYASTATQATGILPDNGYKGTDGVTIVATLVGGGKNYQLVGTNSNLTGKTITYTSADGKSVLTGF